MKSNKKMPKKYIEALRNIFYEITPLTRDVIYFKRQRVGKV